MLWSKFGNNPEWTWDIFGEEFEEVVYKHVDDTMDHFNSLGVVHWDVINEMIDEHQGPLNHTFYIDQSGNENIRADIHIHVKENYPHNMFYVNDYGIIMDTAHRFSSFQKLLRDLFSRGVQIDGIGLQSHINGEHKNLFCLRVIVSHILGHASIDWNLVKQRVETLWEEFQLPIWITEFDWNHDGDVPWGDHTQHSQILQDFYRLMFSQEVVIATKVNYSALNLCI